MCSLLCTLHLLCAPGKTDRAPPAIAGPQHPPPLYLKKPLAAWLLSSRNASLPRYQLGVAAPASPWRGSSFGCLTDASKAARAQQEATWLHLLQSSLQASCSSPILRALLAEQQMQTQLSHAPGRSRLLPCAAKHCPLLTASSGARPPGPSKSHRAEMSPPVMHKLLCHRTAASHCAGASIRNAALTPRSCSAEAWPHSSLPRQILPPLPPMSQHLPSGLLAAPSRCAGLLHPIKELLPNCCCFCLT